VLWKTPLEWTKSSPLVVGGKVFTQVEPHILVCCDRLTGKVLWQRESNPLELMDKALFEQSRKLFEEWQQSRDVAKQTAWIDFIRQQTKCPDPSWYRKGAGDGGHWTGFSFATPVTDGKRIWVKYLTGTVACYDLEGNRQWMERVEFTRGGGAECSSPVLVGNKLVLKLPFHTAKRGAGADGAELEARGV